MASSSSKKKNDSPLAALAPLHALAQLVPAAASPGASSAPAPKDERERDDAFILLASLKPDAWLVHVGHPDGRWWNGAWHEADVEKLARGDMSSTRLGAFAQRVARTIVQREVAIAHEGGDFRNMKLVLGTHAKKPLSLALSELDKEDAARFVFEHFVRVAKDAQAHGCRIPHGDIEHADADAESSSQGVSHPPLKRRRTRTSNDSPTTSRAMSHRGGGGDSDVDMRGISQGSTQRSHDRPTGKQRRAPPPTQAQAQTQAERAAQAEVQELKAQLTKVRADAAAAVALAAEREPHGPGGSIDRLRSRGAVPAVPRRPGASLANPNKAARRVTAVEFASDSD
ncbi:hypothetical protein BC826DRAFT_970085 [Russula brevipes]|nr:hypothetical protein BC826DRAFT_970085 [Russula brevipes]